MTPAHWIRLALTLVAASLVTLYTTPPGYGFMIMFVVLPLLFWIPYSIKKAIAAPEARLVLAVRILIWVSVVSIVGIVHHDRAETARQRADEIVARITQFTSSNGRCATNLDKLGLSESELKETLGTRAYYYCKDGKQSFHYIGTFELASWYSYDFESHTWTYNPD